MATRAGRGWRWWVWVGLTAGALGGAGCAETDGPPPSVPAGAATHLGLEHNIDPPGGDYRDFNMSSPRPQACRDARLGDPRCAAYTYVKRGIQGPFARCWMKDTIVPAMANGCCTSGVKSYAGPLP